MSKAEDSLILCGYDHNSDLEIKTIDYYPTGNPNSQNAIERARDEGLVVVFPKSNELFIDIDNEHSFQLFLKQFDIMSKYLGATGYEQSPSKSGMPKQHVTVYMDRDVTEIERLALQAMLGSDRVRELLGYVQEKNGDPHPTLFLEKKV